MIGKDRIFKNGDVIVSGLGNIRIFTDDKFEGDTYKCLTCYCTSDAPAGTDMRYARHATEKEKRLYFSALQANGLCLDKKSLVIGIADNKPVEDLRNACVDWKADSPLPYKVVKKRVRPTLKEVNELKSGLENERRLHVYFAKEVDKLKVVVKGFESNVKADLDQIDKLTCEKETLQQSNTLMEEELERQKKANIELSKFNDQYKEELAALRGRGFWARVFNR